MVKMTEVVANAIFTDYMLVFAEAVLLLPNLMNQTSPHSNFNRTES